MISKTKYFIQEIIFLISHNKIFSNIIIKIIFLYVFADNQLQIKYLLINNIILNNIFKKKSLSECYSIQYF